MNFRFVEQDFIELRAAFISGLYILEVPNICPRIMVRALQQQGDRKSSLTVPITNEPNSKSIFPYSII